MNNINLKELTAETFIEFFKSDLNQINFEYKRYNRSDILTLMKAKYKNSVIIYSSFCYEDDFNLCNKFEYAGIFDMEGNTFYDIDYMIENLIKDSYKIENMCDLKQEINRKITTRICELVNEFKDNKLIERAKKLLNEDIKYDSGYINNQAKELYFKDELPDLKKFYNICGFGHNKTSMLDYLENKEEFIEQEAKEYIENNLAGLYRGFIHYQEVLKDYKNILSDKTNIIHAKKAISNSVEGKKTVNVTILKNDIEFTFKTNTDTLKYSLYSCAYWSYDIVKKDRKLFYKTFGKCTNYLAEEIQKITYSKKVIYQKAI